MVPPKKKKLNATQGASEPPLKERLVQLSLPHAHLPFTASALPGLANTTRPVQTWPRESEGGKRTKNTHLRVTPLPPLAPAPPKSHLAVGEIQAQRGAVTCLRPHIKLAELGQNPGLLGHCWVLMFQDSVDKHGSGSGSVSV